MPKDTVEPAQAPPPSSGGDLSQIREHAFDDETVFPGPKHLTLWSCVAPMVAEITVGERFHPRRVYQRGDLRLTTPGVPVLRVPDEAAVIRSLSLSSRLCASVLGEQALRSSDLFKPLQRRHFHSPMIESILDQLQTAQADQSPLGRNYFEALTHAVIMELWRLSGAGEMSSDTVSGGLSAAQLRRIDGFIDANLADKIEMTALAQLVQVPGGSFQRAFKQATGRTPYQHILSRRIENARHQIERSRLTLTQIAYRNGFASQSHMTDVFRCRLGVTPGAIRRAKG